MSKQQFTKAIENERKHWDKWVQDNNLFSEYEIVYSDNPYESYDFEVQSITDTKKWYFEVKVRTQKYSEMYLQEDKIKRIKKDVGTNKKIYYVNFFPDSSVYLFDISHPEKYKKVKRLMKYQTMGDDRKVNKEVYLLPLYTATKVWKNTQW